MNIQEVISYHKALCDEARGILEAKSHDYATDKDAISNFRVCEQTGICSAETGVLIRMNDKMGRLAQLITKGEAEVLDERIIDTVKDLLNYTVFFMLLLDERITTEEEEEREEKEAYRNCLNQKERTSYEQDPKDSRTAKSRWIHSKK